MKFRTPASRTTQPTTGNRTAQRATTEQLVYVYDAAGKFLASYKTVTLCAQKLELPRPTVNAGLHRASLVATRYYFSYDKEFKPDNFNQFQNPLQDRTYRPQSELRGMRDQEFYEVIY